ncbi:MAG: DUF4160 domain-containing protein [Saprospirales bacterium]|nr:DUF4160 domain-containing protein [Saprospirales bacterium]
MPTFFIIDGIKVDFYYNDHLPPHFHAVYAEFEELVEIKSLKTWTAHNPRLPRGPRKPGGALELGVRINKHEKNSKNSPHYSNHRSKTL